MLFFCELYVIRDELALLGRTAHHHRSWASTSYNYTNFFLGLRKLQSLCYNWPYAPAEENQGMSGMARRARSAREGA